MKNTNVNREGALNIYNDLWNSVNDKCSLKDIYRFNDRSVTAVVGVPNGITSFVVITMFNRIDWTRAKFNDSNLTVS
jgi:hypothetical protein